MDSRKKTERSKCCFLHMLFICNIIFEKSCMHKTPKCKDYSAVSRLFGLLRNELKMVFDEFKPYLELPPEGPSKD